MDHDANADYAPRSPDLSAQPDTYEPEPIHEQHRYRGSISHISPFTPTGASDSYFGRTPTSAYPPQQFPGPQSAASYFPASGNVNFGAPYNNMVKREDDDGEYGVGKRSTRGKKAAIKEDSEEFEPSGSAGISEVKTKFPVARIKRIMQADEDVGKVAQVTPVAVCKLLPLAVLDLLALVPNFLSSKGTRTLHDFPRHQGSRRSSTTVVQAGARSPS
jgi:hypothetical protein